MIILPLQFDKFSGPDAVGQNKITFTLDESVNSGDFNPLHIKKGTQFIVMMVEVNTQEAGEFISETPEQTKERFWKHAHAIITRISEKKGIKPTQFREEFKETLIRDGIIKKSMTELGLEGLALIISKLKEYEKN